MQAATSYIKETYSVLGVNTDKIQNRYILTTGGKMLALAFLGMLASVTVGLLASRVAASTGRDLRGKVFKKVVGFSNAEFDKFSTASLITRSTNDIQQIQMLAVMLSPYECQHVMDHRTWGNPDRDGCCCIIYCGNTKI